MKDPLVLYGNSFWTSPYFFVCYVALREKGIPFETRDVALHEKEQQRPEFAAKTLTARVPVLEHGSFVLTESMAILDYLERKFPNRPSVFPEVIEEHARAWQIMSWIRSDDTLPLRTERSAEIMFYDRPKPPLSDDAKRAAAKLFHLAEGVLPVGTTRLFERWCIADTDLAFVLNRLILAGDAVPARLRAFAEEQWKRASVVEFVDKKRPAYVAY